MRSVRYRAGSTTLTSERPIRSWRSACLSRSRPAVRSPGWPAPPPPGFKCALSYGVSYGGLSSAWVRADGELDIAAALELERILRGAVIRARLLVLDLRDLTFIDSSGEHVIVDACVRISAKTRWTCGEKGSPACPCATSLHRRQGRRRERYAHTIPIVAAGGAPAPPAPPSRSAQVGEKAICDRTSEPELLGREEAGVGLQPCSHRVNQRWSCGGGDAGADAGGFPHDVWLDAPHRLEPPVVAGLALIAGGSQAVRQTAWSAAQQTTVHSRARGWL